MASEDPERLAEAIRRRKLEHLRLAAAPESGGPVPAGWEDVHLVHDALPDVDAEEIDLGVDLLGRRLLLPLLVVGMTGGHPDAAEVNARLADAAVAHGLGIGVGSQRAALRDPAIESTYAVVRQRAPDALVLANIGVSQLLDQPGEPALRPDEVERIVKMIDADALAVHLNFVEELVQPEGQTRAAGALEALARVVAASPVPVVVKEVGNGLSRGVAERAKAAGAAVLDVGGLGGTSFAAIEASRAAAQGDAVRAGLGRSLAGWGIPTAASVHACHDVLPTIATGGVRDGLDAAKALALGAVAVGVGRPLLAAALEGQEAVAAWMGLFSAQLRAAVLLTGGSRAIDLRVAPRVVTGATRAWFDHFDEGRHG